MQKRYSSDRLLCAVAHSIGSFTLPLHVKCLSCAHYRSSPRVKGVCSSQSIIRVAVRFHQRWFVHCHVHSAVGQGGVVPCYERRRAQRPACLWVWRLTVGIEISFSETSGSKAIPHRSPRAGAGETIFAVPRARMTVGLRSRMCRLPCHRFVLIPNGQSRYLNAWMWSIRLLKMAITPTATLNPESTHFSKALKNYLKLMELL